MKENKINIILITGFLGSGKTTLLNRLIEKYSKSKLGLIINDFGKISVDGILLSNLLKKSEEIKDQSIYEIKNGSIFCSCLSSELVVALKEYIEVNPEILIIETSGLSDPSVFDKILANNNIEQNFNLISSVCIVDPKTVIKLASKIVAIEKQIHSSSVQVINKIDTAGTEELKTVREFIKKYNSNAKIIETNFAQFDLEVLENIFKDGPVEKEAVSCNTVSNRPGSIILAQQDTTIDDLKRFYKTIYNKILRLKGFLNIDENLYYISSNNDVVDIQKYESGYTVELGLSVLLLEEKIDHVLDEWRKISLIKI
jgi:G3E family GTPase